MAIPALAGLLVSRGEHARGAAEIYNLVRKQQILIQKTLDVLSLLRPIVHDISKTAKITLFILVLHWATDVIYDFYYIHGPIEY